MKHCVNPKRVGIGLACFLALFLATATANAGDTASGLKIEFEVLRTVVDIGPNKTKTITHHFIYLVNTGKEDITVLTKGHTQGRGTDSSGIMDVHLGLYVTERRKGKRVIHSLSSYEPVTLHPNEVTQFRTLPHPHEDPFKNLHEEAKQLTVTYEVTKEWGKRFNIWHGKISTQVFDVKEGKIVITEPEKER